ncbi:hypothetical protein LEP1GSC083_0837 [Leptospira interrogans serovar Pyrogenes str. L0374]|uniref:Uncharacterized protein n=2 Tax=Leptospira interrogans TaxID=173 RepID=M6KN20_LEPIR|nr:hypothetical protein LEP1GSC067_4766 [Leptospira interrogans serovar Lora str. TE 1992]EMN29182.1 hypothetical protein LEP1GSC083_0837 [Leptospira interrogans serovar Pyrogenes str. L0374]EMO77786.1 hypothetical protein LEP1GSC127_3178 [Leptospira kirschneri str. 200801925]
MAAKIIKSGKKIHVADFKRKLLISSHFIDRNRGFAAGTSA